MACGKPAGERPGQAPWHLEVVMKDDRRGHRLGNGPNNLAVSRHVALSVVQEDPDQGSSRGKRDEDYLRTLLAMF